ncbi:hypothetical protein N6H14_04445 [Paenibacillus sp. CC-CFT747]|nr:hypothetical protein N6H14_04445 [Paenibacillus sp. CC-CFT747]
MGRKIQAYFHTENEAEDARIRLQTITTEGLEVGELQGGYSGGAPLLVPFALGATNGTSGVGGYVGGSAATGSGADNGSGLAAFVGLNELDKDIHRDSHYDGDPADLRYVLTAEVSTEDWPEAVHVIRSNHGHVEVLD